MDIIVKDIHVDDSWNCRGRFNLQDVLELADSIKRDGQLQDVVVQDWNKDEKRYRLIAGFRRFAAIARVLKRKTIRATVVDVDEVGARTLNLVENLERKNLNVLQEAHAIDALYPESQYGLREVADRLNRHTSWVAQRRQLLRLQDESLRNKFASGRIKIKHIGTVLNAPDPNEACRELERGRRSRGHYPPGRGRRRRNMSDIKRMTARLIECGLEGLPTRLLAWVNGFVSDDDIDYDIEILVSEGR